MMQRVAVLGATGSIGASALDVIARHPQRMRASVLAAGSQVDGLLALCRTHKPEHAVIADAAGYPAPVSYTHLDVYKRQPQCVDPAGPRSH